ncbi:hypothetical protein JOD43_003445 [Pullulanibacillus pueri]|uniref:Histidine kinase n=1 Tax=Pullulanibacillus pueri TaxID=1437324 RepID=A0A8J2ZYX0_9BACL|nr:post-transcriptional regulator [Pullulanibacillus pueri]MBM7683266.1 hypothetical protein [Pullulanibacillus pueri]GGH85780.1 histidine kinase [Pullulanibacillus pueri]
MTDRENQGSFDYWRIKVNPFLQSKLEEFQLLGINHLSLDDLWAFIKEKVQKKTKKNEADEEWRLHQVVGYIMSISVNDYMNKIRLEMFQDEDLLKVTEELL